MLCVIDTDELTDLDCSLNGVVIYQLILVITIFKFGNTCCKIINHTHLYNHTCFIEVVLLHKTLHKKVHYPTFPELYFILSNPKHVMYAVTLVNFC